MAPFDIDPTQIVQLAGNFGLFIARLLEAEAAAHGISGHSLNFNKNENTPGGGVDAALTDAVATSWLPGGSSAWQFKQGNPSGLYVASKAL